MGITLSSADPPKFSNEDKVELGDYFNPAVIKFIKLELQKLHPNDTTKILAIEPTLLSRLLENLLALQLNSGQVLVPKDLEASFYQPIQTDLAPFFEDGTIFVKHFDHLRDVVGKTIDKLNESDSQKAIAFAEAFKSVNIAASRDSIFLEDLLSTAFDTLFPSFIDLSPDLITKTLDDLISIVVTAPHHAMAGASSSVLNSLHKLTSYLSSEPKFQILEIRYRVILLLFNIAILQGNVAGCISALNYMVTLPPDFKVDSTLRDIKFSDLSSSNVKPVVFQHDNPGELYDFSIHSKCTILLTQEKGIICHTPSFIRHAYPKVTPTSKLAFFDENIFVFDTALDVVQYTTFPKLDAVDVLDKSVFCAPDKEIVSTYGDDTRMFICQHDSGDNYVIITVKGKMGKFEVTSAPITVSNVKTVFFQWSTVIFICADRNLLQYAIRLDGSISEPRTIHGYQYQINNHSKVMKNRLYTYSIVGNEISFSPISLALCRSSDFHFTRLQSNSSNIQYVGGMLSNLLQKLVMNIDGHIEAILNCEIFGATPGYSFFIDAGAEGIKLGHSMVALALNNSNLSQENVIHYISFGLKLIGLVLFGYSNKFTNPELKPNHIDFDVFSTARDAIDLAVFSPYAKENPLILESALSIIRLTFRYLYMSNMPDFATFLTKIFEVEELKEMIQTRAAILRKCSAVLYMYTDGCKEYIFYPMNQQDSDKFLSAGLKHILSELSFYTKYEMMEVEEETVNFFEACLNRIFQMISKEKNPKGIKMLHNLLILAPSFDKFPAISATIATHSIPIMEYYADFYSQSSTISNNDIYFTNKPTDFNPDPSLFFFNLLANTIGHLIETGLKSLPLTNIEIENKIILQSDILNGAPPVFQRPESPQRVRGGLQRTPVKTEQPQEHQGIPPPRRQLSRGISRGLSFDASKVGNAQHSEALKKGFINDIISKNQRPNGLGEIFLNSMYSSVKTNIQLNKDKDLILEAEKFAVAAFIKQLGFVGNALSFAMTVSQQKLQPGPEMLVPPNLKLCWKALYLLRRDIIKHRQLHRDDFPDFLIQAKMKCEFLLYSDPLLKKRYGENQTNFETETIDKTLSDLVKFITSALPMAALSEMIDRRTRRLEIRKSMIGLLREIVAKPHQLKTFELAMMIPLSKSLALMANKDDINSVHHSLLESYNAEVSDYALRIVERIAHPETTTLQRMLFIRLISVPISIILPETINQIISTLLDVVSKYRLDSIESHAIVSALWRLIGLFVIVNSSIEVAETLIKYAESHSESYKHKIYLLLATLVVTNDIVPITIQHAFSLIPPSSPRCVNTLFILLSSIISLHGIMPNFVLYFDAKRFTFEALIEFIVEGIGSALSGKSCYFLSDDTMPESHQLVAGEMISFIRILLRPFSQVHERVQAVLHSIFAAIGQQMETAKAIGLFAVLGQEVIGYHQSGYAIKIGSHIDSTPIKITAYDPCSSRIRAQNVLGTSDQVTKETDFTLIPSSRILCNPSDFTIHDDEFKVISMLHNAEKKNLTNEQHLLYASFYSFLPVAFQTQANAMKFFEHMNFNDFIQYAISDGTSDVNVGQLMHNINQNTLRLAEAKEAEKEVTLPYTLAFNSSTSTKMIALSNGNVEEGFHLIAPTKRCIFVGNCLVPRNSLYYFEVELLSETGICSIGLVDTSCTKGTINMYEFNFKDSQALSPQYDSKKEEIVLHKGDVFGVGYNRQSIIFFLNGKRIDSYIPNPQIENFSPIVYTREHNTEWKVNLGQSPFVTSISDQSDFSVDSDCTYTFPLPNPTKSVKAPETHEFGQVYLDFLKTGQTVFDNPIPFDEKVQIDLLEMSQQSEAKTDMNNGHYTVYEGFDYPYVLGQPVEITYLKTEKENPLPLEAQLHFHKYGIVTAREGKDDVDCNIQVEFVNPEKNETKSIWLESAYVTRVDVDLPTIIKYAGRRPSLITTRLVHDCLDQNAEYVQKLSVHMCRYLVCILLDLFRLQPILLEKVDNNKLAEVLQLMMMETFNFSSSVRVVDHWTAMRPSDYPLQTHECSVGEIAYKVPGDRKAFRRIVRAFLNINKAETIMHRILVIALDQLVHSPKSTAADIYETVPHKFRLESWHPCPSTDIDSDVDLSRFGAIGHIPVIHPNHSAVVKVEDDEPLIDAITSSRIIYKTHLHLVLDSHANPKYGPAVAFLPFYQFLEEKYYSSSFGGAHSLVCALSLVLSLKFDKTNLSIYIKREVLPTIASAMGVGNFFADIFAFSIIAPILTQFEWTVEDVDDKVSTTFNSFGGQFELTITKWEPLSTFKQSAILLRMFTQLLLLDTQTPTNPTPEGIGTLYDSYLEATTQKTTFRQIIDSFTYCAALGHDLPIKVRFPAFLIAESWAESIEVHKTLEGSSGDEFEVCDCSSVSIELPSTAKFGTDQVLLLKSETSTSRLVPGQSVSNFANKFTATVIDKSTGNAANTSSNFTLLVKYLAQTAEDRRSMFIRNYPIFLRHVQFMSTHWSPLIDETLMKLLKSNPDMMKERPINLEHAVQMHPEIAGIPAELIRCRILLFKALEDRINNIIKVVHFGSTDSILGQFLTSCRAAIQPSVKATLLEQVVRTDLSSSDRLNLQFNRFKASVFHSDPSKPNGESLMAQFVRQTPEDDLAKMKCSGRPWHVDLIGEGATDAGGPARDLFSEICMEVMHPSLGLFMRSPDGRSGTVSDQQDLLVLQPGVLTEQKKTWYYYAGVLMSLCYIDQLSEPFRLSRSIWNGLCGRKITINDIYETDHSFKDTMLALEECAKTMDIQQDSAKFASQYQYPFTCQNSMGEDNELIPGGSSIMVTLDRVDEYVQRCKKFRLNEFTVQMDALRAGFNKFFAASIATILTPWELELFICGDTQCPIADMKKVIKFDDNGDDTRAAIEMLWRVLETFTPLERMLFLKFGSGRMGLPPPGSSVESLLSISFKSSSKPDPQKPLPTSATCSSHMYITKCQTDEWLGKKIRAAILFGADIDQDHDARLSDLTEFT